MSLARLAGLHPAVRDAARNTIEWGKWFGLEPTVTSGYRSCAEQERLRRRWREGKNPYPASRPGFSAHNFGLAWDSSVPRNRELWVALRRWLGWNVPSNDLVHAEVPGWSEFVEVGKC